MGLSTMFGCESGTKGKTVFMGLPFAHGSEAPNGCQHGPSVIRSLSHALNMVDGRIFCARTNSTFLKSEDLSDLGDLQFKVQLGTERYLKAIEEITSALVETKKKFLYFGGDHLASLGAIKGIGNNIPAFQILHLDAHRDYRIVSDDHNPTHANFMYVVEKMPQVKKIIQVGLRGFDVQLVNSKKRLELNSEVGIKEELRKSLDPNIPIYVTIDTDAFDPNLLPSVNFPVPGGLSLKIVEELFHLLVEESIDVLGCDWMEYNPSLDTSNKISGNQILFQLAYIIKHLSKLK